MKKLIALLLAMLLCLGLFAGCNNSDAAPDNRADGAAGEQEPGNSENTAASEQASDIRELSFQIGHIDAAAEYDHADVICNLFAKYAAELSGGKIQIEVVPAAGLGSEAETIEGMALGTVDAAICGNPLLSSYVPKMAIFDLPYLVTSRDEAAAVIGNKDIMSYFDDQLYDVASVKVLARGECGFRHFVNNTRPITTMSDLQGLKVRTMEGTVPVSTWNALGANATPMSWSETYTGYVQGTVDAVELPFNSIVANGFDQISAYCSMTNHQYLYDAICFSRSFWEGLSTAEQDVLQEAADLAAQEQIAVMAENDQNFIAQMAENGCVVNEIEDLSEFVEATAFLYDDYREQLGDVYTAIMAALGR